MPSSSRACAASASLAASWRATSDASLGFEAAADVDCGELAVFRLRIVREFAPLPREVGALAVGLRADGDVLARRHGHGARDEAGEPGGQHGGAVGAGGRDSDQEAGGRDDPVIRAQDGSAKPARTVRPVPLPHFWLKA